MKVLFVEDYPPLRAAVGRGLKREGFAVDVAATGSEGMWCLKVNHYDVVILDLMLPEVSGLEILQWLRRQRAECPVLILSARDQVQDRIHGLNLGADDYMIKPFIFDELVARLRALVRRGYNERSPLLKIGDLNIDTVRKDVQRGDRDIDLTAKEYALLEYLAHRPNEVVSRPQIWQHVYDFDSEPQSNVVDVYVGYLRRKLEIDGLPRIIHTKRGIGFILKVLED